MTDERQSDVLFESWLKDTDPMPPDARPSVARVMARVPQTHQRGRWWPLPVFDRPAPIPPTNGPTPARGFTMFSALKFIVAGVIVALFGGFLLAGVLTSPQDGEAPPAAVSASPATEATSEPTETPTTPVRTDILPGVDLTVEEVGPGVYRVANDGVRDLVFGSNTGIAAGHDGGVWLLRKNQFFRLGSDEWHEREDSQPVNDFLVAPDGTAWTIEELDSWLPMARLRSFDGETWTTHHSTTPSAALDVDADGKVWAAWLQKAAPPLAYTMAVGYFDSDVWQPIGEFDESKWVHSAIATVSGTGDVWVVSESPLEEGRPTDLQRYVDGAWRATAWQPPGLTRKMKVDAGPDGTFWAMRNGSDGLFRFDGEGWAAWDVRHDFGIDPLHGGGSAGVDGPFEVAPDGSLWVGWRVHDEEKFRCDGVRRFDGAKWDHYLPDMCVRGAGPVLDISTDGSVWVLAGETERGKGPLHLYVITPEAVAASE